MNLGCGLYFKFKPYGSIGRVKSIKKERSPLKFLEINMKRRILATMGLRFLIMFVFFATGVGYAQDGGGISPFGPTSGIFRSRINIISDGGLLVDTTYAEGWVNYSFDASADAGRASVYNTLSSVPFDVDGRLFRTATNMGFDALGTEGQLVGQEVVIAGVCAEDFATGMIAGARFELTQGGIHFNTRATTSNFVSDFSGVAAGTGSLEVGVMAISTSDGSSGSYSQTIQVEGEFSLDYSTNVALSVGGCNGLW